MSEHETGAASEGSQLRHGDVSWTAPAAIECASFTRWLVANGVTVGAIEEWWDEKAGAKRYEARVIGPDGSGRAVAFGGQSLFADGAKAMTAVEAELGIRPLAHCEVWGIGNAEYQKRCTDPLDEFYLVRRGAEEEAG